MEYLPGLYGCMFLVGLMGNGSLFASLCLGPGPRARSPILLGLVAADFLVCSLSGPATAALYIVPHENWTQPWLRIAQFMQAWPVSASTLSMMAISVDRYLTVKNYRPERHVYRKYVLRISIIAWIFAAGLACFQLGDNNPWRTFYLVATAVMVYILPICVVFSSHLLVHAKLTAYSLTARARRGELPLPMPLIKKEVIIVAGIPHGMDIGGDDREIIEIKEVDVRRKGADTELKELNTPEEQKMKKTSSGRKLEKDSSEEIPPSCTLEIRLHIASSLIWMAVVFVACWLPHVVCFILTQVGWPPPSPVLRYSLFLGHVHSAFAPFLYWAFNYKMLDAPWKHWRQCKLPRFRVRLRSPYRNASSTNEAALGPFNPRYAVARPPPQQVRRQSSHYFF